MRKTIILTIFILMCGNFILVAETADEWIKRIRGQELSYTVDGAQFKMVVITPGWYEFGDGHRAFDVVKGVGSFLIGQTEVTQQLWISVMGYNPSTNQGLNRPVENVNWNECQMFVLKLNKLLGQQFRLPTECEWEAAAKASVSEKGVQGTKFSGSNKAVKVAWTNNNSNNLTHQVALLSPNRYKLYDMSGNVAEWCDDWYMDDESTDIYGFMLNPRGQCNLERKDNLRGARVYRGGSFADNEDDCTVISRKGAHPGFKSAKIGLRLAMDLPTELKK